MSGGPCGGMGGCLPPRSSLNWPTRCFSRSASSPRSCWAAGREAGWNYVPRPALQGGLLVPFGILLPDSILTADWYQALCLWVGFNTLVSAFLSLLRLFPPLRLEPRLHRCSQG